MGKGDDAKGRNPNSELVVKLRGVSNNLKSISRYQVYVIFRGNVQTLLGLSTQDVSSLADRLLSLFYLLFMTVASLQP
jgi:hypothetical protein